MLLRPGGCGRHLVPGAAVEQRQRLLPPSRDDLRPLDLTGDAAQDALEFLAAGWRERQESALQTTGPNGGSMLPMEHRTLDELESGLAEIRRSPRDDGAVQLIVRRPATLEREVVQQAELDLEQGLVGDNWKARGSRKTPDGSAHPDMQLTIMNARAIGLIARETSRWALAGDQLYADLDLSAVNLPAGTRLAVGSAVLEVSETPHTGCRKFSERFGSDALRFVNSPRGRELRLRGVNARVVQPGTLRTGDRIRKA